MTYTELIDICAAQDQNEFIVFPEIVFESITIDLAEAISRKYHNQKLMRLPEKEIKFFEWLKTEDEKVWEDLWGGETINGPYIVGISFLPLLIYSRWRGFPICDLLSTDNYFFTMAQMVDAESNVLIESAKTLFMDRIPMTPAQLLALEISMDPIDIWHFAYKHNIQLDLAKQAVKILVEDNALVHLTDAEHLAIFIDF